MLLIHVLLSTSFASVHDVELSIPAPTQSAPAHVTETVAGRQLNGVADNVPDGVYSSTSNLITCEVEDGDVTIVARWNPHNWPTFPTHADCTFSGETLRVIPVVDVPRTSWVPATIDPQATTVVPKHTDMAGYAIYLLPGTGWTEAVVDGTLDSAIWTGLTCDVRVDGNGQWFLKLDMDDASVVLGEGHCALPRASGPDHTLALRLEAP